MDKASYSLSAIAQCKELIRKAHWSTKNCTKIQLDNQLRVCRAFAETQISLIEKDIRDGSVNSVP